MVTLLEESADCVDEISFRRYQFIRVLPDSGRRGYGTSRSRAVVEYLGM